MLDKLGSKGALHCSGLCALTWLSWSVCNIHISDLLEQFIC